MRKNPNEHEIVAGAFGRPVYEPRSADAQRPFKTSSPAKTAEMVSALPTSTATQLDSDAKVAKALTLDEARRIVSNIGKLPHLLAKGD